MFKVVPDQLRVSEGWVRCGQCDEVFDAQAHLIDPKSLHVDIPPKQQTSPEPERANPVSYTEAASVASSTPTPLNPLSSESEVVEAGGLMPDTQPLLVSEPWTDDVEQVMAPVSSAVTEVQSPSALPSFMRRTASGKPWVQNLTLGGAMLLCLCLLGQFAWRERDRMSAASGAVAGLWQRVCPAFGCELHPWRDVDALMLESSSFVKVRGNVYQIQAEIRNKSSMQLAAPALELTLTDLQEKPAVRKVLPADQIWGGRRILNGQELAATDFAVEINLPDADKVVSGYRLIAFYP